MGKFLDIKKFIAALFGINIDSGSIVVSPGTPSQIEIKLGYKPFLVSLSFKDDCLPPVCVGETDSFDIRITHHGFILINKVKSSSREIQWTAEGLLF